MKTLYLLVLVLFVARCQADDSNPKQASRETKRISLWNGQAMTGEDVVERDDAWITIHQPSDPNGTAIVICPGGGYGGLVVGPEGHGIAAWLNQHGITGVVLEYRLPAGRHAIPLIDAQRAVRTVRSNAKRWQLDPTRVGVIGFSAGGHLASTLATHFDYGDESAIDMVSQMSCRPDFAILVYPVVSLGENGHAGTKRNLLGTAPAVDLVKLYSNELHVTHATPPMLMTHALDDQIVSPENSQLLFAALQENGIPSEYLELPSGGHGLNGYKGEMWETWQTKSLEWLNSLAKQE